jgi:F0F1-type ATP synthase assembly protein I
MKKRARADSTSSGADEGWAVLTTLIAGFVVWGGLGWLLDRWWGTTFLTPVGVIVGMALGVFAVVARHGGLKTTGAPVVRSENTKYLHGSAPDPRTGPPPASTRRETECP